VHRRHGVVLLNTFFFFVFLGSVSPDLCPLGYHTSQDMTGEGGRILDSLIKMRSDQIRQSVDMQIAIHLLFITFRSRMLANNYARSPYAMLCNILPR
jgi:hypothetical protein